MRAFLIALLVATPAVAAPDARALWRDGKFAAAAEAARTSGDGAFAARSLLAVAAFEATDRAQALALIDKARAEAEAALATNPQNADAAVQKGLAIGYAAKFRKTAGAGKAAKKAMTEAVALALNDPLAIASLAGFHGDSIDEIGKTMAGMVFGSKMSEATRLSELAIAKEPANPVFPTAYAMMLLRLGSEHAEKAEAHLARASTLRPRDAFERRFVQLAQRIVRPLKAGDVPEARSLATSLQPFGGVLAKK